MFRIRIKIYTTAPKKKSPVQKEEYLFFNLKLLFLNCDGYFNCDASDKNKF